MRRSLTIFLYMLSFGTMSAQYTIHNVFGNLTDCDTMTRGIYIVWWDHDFNYATKVNALLDTMIRYRDACLNELGMSDPPNPLDGYYYNVYIHTPGNGNDLFSQYGWGNGQGTDINGYPFLTLPQGVLSDWVNNAHETFHIFQYNGTSPGFAYSGNSQWYIEGSANWFAGKENPGAPRAWVEAESLVRMPQVPLWLSYNNYPSYYPSNWQRYVHQYASALLLYYLTDVAGVPDHVITDGFFDGTELYPQEYFYATLGGETFRNYFVDWAAHMTNHFDFIEPNQALTNENEWNNYADPLDDNEYTQTYYNSGTGDWYRPDDSVVTTAWSFNTYKVVNDIPEQYTFEFNGDAIGSDGDDAWFQAKVVVQNSSGSAAFYDVPSTDGLQGSLSIAVTAADTALYFIIASVPEVFGDDDPVFQTFPYEVRITTGVSGTSDLSPRPKYEVARYNIMGQVVDRNYIGAVVILYNDGSVDKVYAMRN